MRLTKATTIVFQYHGVCTLNVMLVSMLGVVQKQNITHTKEEKKKVIAI